MTQLYRRLACLFVFGIVLATNAFAQTGIEPRKLTLDECVSIGLEKNTTVIRSRYAIDRAKAARTDALGQFVPSLQAGASWDRVDRDRSQYINNRLVTSRDNYSISASSSLTLFDGLANIKSFDKSVTELEATRLDFDRQKETYVYSVQDAYYDALRIGQLVDVNKANLERAQKQLDRIREQNAVGSIPMADVYRQEVELGRYNLQYLQAVNDFDNAKAELLNLIGENPSMQIALDESNSRTTVSTQELDEYAGRLADVNALIGIAREKRLDYQSSKLGIESAGTSVDIAWADSSRGLSAGARYNWSNIEFKDVFNDGSFSYGLTLSIPIMNNFRTQTNLQRSRITEMETQEIHKELERTIAVNIRKAVNALEYAAQNVRITQQTLRSAQEDQRIASERYNLGAGILLDLITANANLISVESDVVNARFNYIRARAFLEYQLGTTL